MKNNKRKLAAVCAAVMAASCVSGCMNNTASDKKVRLKYVMIGPGMQADSKKVWAKVNEQIAQKGVNAEVNFEIIPLSEYSQKFMLMTSAREQIDIASNYGLDFGNEVRNGTFEPLDELIDKYGKGIKKSIPDWLFDYQKVDEKIYGIPGYQPLYNTRGIYFFKELADKYLDTDALTEALYKTTTFNEDFYKVLTKFLDDMNADGLKFKDVGILNPKGYDGIVDVYAIKRGEKPVIGNYSLGEDAYVRYKTARDWYKKGYIREDVLSATDSQNYIGKIDGYPFWEGGYDPHTAENESKKYGREVIGFPLEQKEYAATTLSAKGVSIAAVSEYKEQAMQVLNLIESDKDIYNLLTFGIEGEHYTKVNDDRITPNYKESPTADDKYGLYGWTVGNTSLSYLTPTQPDDYKEWLAETYKTDFRSPIIGFSADTSEIQDYLTQVKAVRNKYFQPLAAGVNEDWEAQFESFKAEMDKVGNKQIVETLQKQIDDFVAENNK